MIAAIGDKITESLELICRFRRHIGKVGFKPGADEPT